MSTLSRTASVDNVPLESWQRVWRDGFAVALSPRALAALAAALRSDDPALIQGATTSPPPLACVGDWPVEAACALSYCGWRGENLPTVAEVEAWFAEACFACNLRLGETTGCRIFLNWFDETPREQMRRLLLPEVERALAERLREGCPAA